MAKRDIQQTAITTNQKLDFAVAAVDSIDIVAIFTLLLKETLHHLLDQYLKFILFPIAAAANVIRAGLAWRHAKLEGGMSLIARAIVETLGAIAITTAVVGGLAFATTFTLISPIIFTATLSTKTLFHTGAAIFHCVQLKKAERWEQKQEQQQKMIGNAAAAIGNGLAACAVFGVMLAGKIALAFAGIASGVVGSAFAIFKICSSLSATEAQKDISIPNEGLEHKNALTQNAQLVQALNQPNIKLATQEEEVKRAEEPTPTKIEPFSPKIANCSEKNLFKIADKTPVLEDDGNAPQSHGALSTNFS